MHMGAVGRPKVRHLEILAQWNLSRGGKLQLDQSGTKWLRNYF
jgi:hypothetical protein